MVSTKWAFLLASVALVSGVSCSKPTKVTVTPKQVLLNDAGSGKNLQASVFDQKDRPMEKAKVIFVSSAPDVAEVDETGKVTAKSTGETTVTATCGKASGAATVLVHLVSSLKVSGGEGGISGLAGATVPLRVSGLDEKGEAVDLTGIAFTSSKPGVATVDKGGVLTLLSTGTTVVEAALGKTKTSTPVEVHVLVPMAIKVPTPPVQTLAVGETTRLDVTVLSDLGLPMKAPMACVSSADQVATVDANGMVTGITRGTAEITVTAGSAKNTLKVVVR